MNITHITKNTCTQKWIFEPCTAMEHQAIERFISSLKSQYEVDIEEINESFARAMSADSL